MDELPKHEDHRVVQAADDKVSRACAATHAAVDKFADRIRELVRQQSDLPQQELTRQQPPLNPVRLVFVDATRAETNITRPRWRPRRS